MKYFLIIVVLFIGCKSNSAALDAPALVNNQELLIEEERNNSEKNISIKFKNVSNDEVVLLDPLDPKIEKWNGEEWEKVAVRYCACGVPCPAPPNERSIEKGGYFTFTWDRMLEKCVQGDDGMMSQKNKASKGLFRVLYKIRGSDSNLYLEARFTIEA